MFFAKKGRVLELRSVEDSGQGTGDSVVLIATNQRGAFGLLVSKLILKLPLCLYFRF